VQLNAGLNDYLAAVLLKIINPVGIVAY